MKNSRTEQSQPSESKELHSPFYPKDIRPGEGVVAYLNFSSSNSQEQVELPVWRFSPLGVELIVDDIVNKKLPPGSLIDLKIMILNNVAEYSGVIVQNNFSDQSHLIMGIRLVPDKAKSDPMVERRKHRRWLTSDQFLPTAVCVNPCQFNDFIYLTVVDISPTGFQLRTSLRNKFIIKGMKLNCMVNFPIIGEKNIKIEIVNTRIVTHNGKDFLSLGTSIINMTNEMRSIIGQYVLQFGPNVTVKELEEEGFIVNTLSTIINYGTVRSKEEFDEVLKLRKLSYSQSKKIAPNTPIESLSDIYDSRARILTLKIKNTLVSTVRLIFNDHKNKSEQEQFIEWPEDFPRRDEVVEITRACTHPGYRGKDLLIELFKHVALTTVQSKRRWIVICATDEMAPVYTKIGFKLTKHNYLHASLNNTKHHVMIADVPKAMCGNNVSPLYWNIIWKDVSKYMRNYDLIRISTFDQIRIFIYRLFSPISKITRGIYIRRKKKLTNKIEKNNLNKQELKEAV